MKVTIEETLAASDVTTALTTGPYLIYSEVLEGARRPLVFLQVVQEDFSLIGATGITIQFLKASQLSGTQITEANILASGMTGADKSLSAVSVSVPDVIYSAVQLSDILKEDYPRINFVQKNMQNMGKAVMEFLDALVYTTIAAASGVVTKSVASLSYSGLISALAAMKNNDWYPDIANPPFLLIAPDASAILQVDTTYVTSERYTAAHLATIVAGEAGRYAGMRVLETSYLDGKAYAFIVFPNNTENGPVVIMAWKRRLTVKNERQEKYGYEYFVTTIRAKPVVVQAKGICKITQSTTP